MTPARFTVLMASSLAVLGCTSGDDTYTLYRNSVLDAGMRVHVASFDSRDGNAYNNENCEVARSLFQAQESVSVRYWCEPGRFRE